MKKKGGVAGAQVNRRVTSADAKKRRSSSVMSLSLVQIGELVIMRQVDLNLRLLAARRLSPDEDRLLHLWAESCMALHWHCEHCKHAEQCQHLADKLIGRVRE